MISSVLMQRLSFMFTEAMPAKILADMRKRFRIGIRHCRSIISFVMQNTPRAFVMRS